ncbi:MFS transporter [Candidatus Dojkabacteria bacterium]|uniref:MFS transporter n=1 Tax=Candidatus Dojkabacteria bacterium TaxID=2099670 RepID=A0A955IAP6_9BACT|nr:MFS transporter [Candidatus Dojkabacteria bacterium]
MIERNTKVFYLTQFSHALIFSIPIWVVFYLRLFSPAQIALINGITFAVQMLFELPSGALADLLGRRTTILISFVLGGLSYILIPFGDTFLYFIILGVLLGISDSFRSGAEEAIIYDTFKEKDSRDFEKVFSKGNIIYQVGLITATILGGLLYVVNIYLPFIFYGISLIVGAIISYFYIEPHIDSEKFSVKNYVKQIERGFKEVFKDKLTTYTTLFYVAVGGITWTNALYFGSFFVVGLGFNDAERGFIQGGSRLINVFLFAFLLKKVKFSDRFKVIIFPIAMVIAFLPGTFLTGWYGVPFFALALLTTTGRWIFLAPITNKMFESKVRATAISVMSLLIGFVYLSLVGISGFVIERYEIGGMYSVLGIMTLIFVVPLSYLLLKVKRHDKTRILSTS